MKNFIKYWFISVGVMFFMTSIFNVLIDPYYIFNVINVPGINHNKPIQGGWEQVHKTIQLYRMKPEHIILGSSVAQYGLRPSFARELLGLKSYNMGIDGPTIFEVYKLFGFSINNSDIKSATLSLELMMFNGERGLNNSRFNDQRMEVVLKENSLNFLTMKELYRTVSSTRALKDSFDTLIGQYRPSYYYDDGFINYSLEQKNMDLSFQRSNSAYIDFLKNQNRNEKYFITNKGVNLIDVFKDLLALSHQNGIKLDILISPVHDYFLDSIKDKNLLSTYDLWKEMIVQANVKIAAEYKTAPYRFVDFSEHDMSKEVIPKGNNAKMKYWKDAYHFSYNLGDQILEELYKK
ncbi:MAG: hypothetical protein V7776_15895 [Halopseudomonas aestusnigri]